MTYFKYLLALLFSLLQLNLFWSDKSETICAKTEELYEITGLYDKYIMKLKIGNVEIDLTNNV